MSLWFLNIEKGDYTTSELVEKSGQIYITVYSTLKRLNVESVDISPKEKKSKGLKNDKKWKWKGGNYYFKKMNRKKNDAK